MKPTKKLNPSKISHHPVHVYAVVCVCKLIHMYLWGRLWDWLVLTGARRPSRVKDATSPGLLRRLVATGSMRQGRLATGIVKSGRGWWLWSQWHGTTVWLRLIVYRLAVYARITFLLQERKKCESLSLSLSPSPSLSLLPSLPPSLSLPLSLSLSFSILPTHSLSSIPLHHSYHGVGDYARSTSVEWLQTGKTGITRRWQWSPSKWKSYPLPLPLLRGRDLLLQLRVHEVQMPKILCSARKERVSEWVSERERESMYDFFFSTFCSVVHATPFLGVKEDAQTIKRISIS